MPHARCADALEQTFVDFARTEAYTLFLFAGPRAENDPLHGILRKQAGAARVRAVSGAAAAMGAALGAAAGGARVVLSLDDAAHLAEGLSILMEQGSAGYFLTQGALKLPLLIRYAPAARSGFVALEGLLAHDPGLLIAVPSTPYDARGMLRTALRDESTPVLFVCGGDVSQVEGEVPEGDYTLPFGSASLRRRGRDISVVASGALANAAQAACERAAAEEGVDAELIDLRSLRPLDVRCVLESLTRTGRLLLCSDCPRTGNYLNELAQQAHEHGFDDLDAPVRRVFAADTSVPASTALAAEAAPGVERILQAIRELARE